MHFLRNGYYYWYEIWYKGEKKKKLTDLFPFKSSNRKGLKFIPELYYQSWWESHDS